MSASSSIVSDRSDRDGPGDLHTEVLDVIEIDADERLVAVVLFDLDDFDAAFGELDARYLAGEAHRTRTRGRSSSAPTRRSTARSPATTPDWVNVDHRRGITFAPGDLTAYIRATWDVASDVSIYIEAVHRLSDLGAIVTHVRGPRTRASTPSGGRSPSDRRRRRSTAARSSTRQTSTPRSRGSRNSPGRRATGKRGKPVTERFIAHFAARDWDAWPKSADDFPIDDRRRVVNAGIRHGRDAEIEDSGGRRRRGPRI